MKPLRPCNQRGCHELVRPPARYCQAHEWTDEQRREHNRERHRRYDSEQRDREAKRFYASAAWQRARQFVLARDQFLCVTCLANQRITPAEHVDHIKPMREHLDLRLDPNNLRSLCASCHSRRHAKDTPRG